jgi:phosphoglycerate dehydrogenase-like enzyme
VTWPASEDEAGRIRRHLPDGVELVPAPARPYQARYVCDPRDIVALARDVDAILGWTPIPDEAIEGAERLRFISWLHAGCDQLNLPLLRARGIQVSNVTQAHARTVAEYTFTLLLAAAKRLIHTNHLMMDGRSEGWWDPGSTSRELDGATLLVIGLGSIGEHVARFGAAFGMRVIGVKRDPSRHAGTATLVVASDRLHDVLPEADFVTLSAPLSPRTRHLIGEPELRRMRPTAILINNGRGDLVHEEPLARALQEGWIAGYAADCWWSYADTMPAGYHYPNPSRSGIHRLPNVIATGDAGANVLAIKDRMIDHGAIALGAFARGETPPRLVNLELGY